MTTRSVRVPAGGSFARSVERSAAAAVSLSSPGGGTAVPGWIPASVLEAVVA